jgi:ribonuclease Z
MSVIRHLAAGLLAAAFLAGPSTVAQPAPAPDALKVTLCGTSGPLPVRDRAKSCTAIQAGGSLYLVDIGPEATENLQTWRLPVASAKAVFITHLHSDHIGDLGEFNMQSWVQGRPAALAVVGPPGVEKLAAGFNQAYEIDHGFRRAHHEHDGVAFPISAGLLAAKILKMPAAKDAATPVTTQAWSENGLTVTAIVVAHDPATPAYAYRFDYKGRSVVVSGDTRKWPPLAVASKDADVLIHEAQNADMTRQMVAGLKIQNNPRLSSVMNDTLSYHTTPVEAAEIAKAAGAKALVLDHITQAGLPFYTPESFTKGVDAVGGPGWRLAKDGMTIELPVGSAEIRFGQLP